MPFPLVVLAIVLGAWSPCHAQVLRDADALVTRSGCVADARVADAAPWLGEAALRAVSR